MTKCVSSTMFRNDDEGTGSSLMVLGEESVINGWWESAFMELVVQECLLKLLPGKKSGLMLLMQELGKTGSMK